MEYKLLGHHTQTRFDRVVSNPRKFHGDAINELFCVKTNLFDINSHDLWMYCHACYHNKLH